MDVHWQVLSTLSSIIAAAVALWTRAIVAELKLDITERQEERCKECHRACDRVADRLTFLEGELEGEFHG